MQFSGHVLEPSKRTNILIEYYRAGSTTVNERLQQFFAIPNGALMLLRPRAADWIEPVRSTLVGYGKRISPGLGWIKEAMRAKLPGAEKRTGLLSCPPGRFFVDAPVLKMGLRPMPSRSRKRWHRT